MKILSVSLVILITILSFFIIFDYYLTKDCKAIISEIEKADDYFSANNMDEAATIFETVQELWDQKERYLQIQIEHSELDEINSLFARMKAALTHHEDEYYMLSSDLKFFIRHLYEKNKLKPETIF